MIFALHRPEAMKDTKGALTLRLQIRKHFSQILPRLGAHATNVAEENFSSEQQMFPQFFKNILLPQQVFLDFALRKLINSI